MQCLRPELLIELRENNAQTIALLENIPSKQIVTVYVKKHLFNYLGN